MIARKKQQIILILVTLTLLVLCSKKFLSHHEVSQSEEFKSILDHSASKPVCIV